MQAHELVTTGVWVVKPGADAAFVEEWTRFAGWAATFEGSTTLRLGRDLASPNRYVSFAAWTDPEAAHAWKQSPEFRERMGKVQQHVEGFEPAEVSVVAVVQKG